MIYWTVAHNNIDHNGVIDLVTKFWIFFFYLLRKIKFTNIGLYKLRKKSYIHKTINKDVSASKIAITLMMYFNGLYLVIWPLVIRAMMGDLNI